MIAVIPVRDGTLPVGADEAVAEAGGIALVIGSGSAHAAATLTSAADARCAEVGPFAPGAWAVALRELLAGEDVVILPACPDGRDLAPRVAFAMGRPLLAGASSVSRSAAVLVRQGGLVAEHYEIDAPVVATLEPGVRGVAGGCVASISALDVPVPAAHDAVVEAVLPPDPATMDLAEAPRIMSGGAGLAGAEPFETLRRVAVGLRCAWGASRVAADIGWVPQDRFIGTTGVVVSPQLYVAFGISGAVQHVSGLGDPRHVVAVNTDASAPMMDMADLAIVSDASAVLEELATRVGAAPVGAAGGQERGAP